MVKFCYKCGRGSSKRDISNINITLFSIPTNKSSKWREEFCKRLGVHDFEDEDIHICSRHFKSDELEMVNDTLQLKENALPIENDVEEIEEYVEVKPELVYLKYNGEGDEIVLDSSSESGETKELAPLERLVEYVHVYNDDEEADDTDVKIETVDEVSEADDNGLFEDCNTEGNGSQVISVVQSPEANFQIEPMMPFFLTSSPVFTILNENNEVGETIILQIENSDEKTDPLSDTDLICELQTYLCKSKDSSITSKYSCDICDESYGCINCLKSHYETLHITNTVTKYKCKFSYHVSRSLVCPVCDLTFCNKNDTMDHYITHSVACEICGSGFDRQSYLTDHYKTSHNKGNYQTTYECELCKTVYQYPVSLTKHYQSFHKMVLCHICKLRFISNSELQEHEKVHRQKLNILPFACSKCDKAFPKISDIAVHIRQYHKKDCLDCPPDIVQSVDVSGDDSVGQMPVQKKLKVRK